MLAVIRWLVHRFLLAVSLTSWTERTSQTAVMVDSPCNGLTDCKVVSHENFCECEGAGWRCVQTQPPKRSTTQRSLLRARVPS
jgi:hypothetical protein